MFNPNIKSYSIFKDDKLNLFRKSFGKFHRQSEITKFELYQPQVSASNDLYLANPLTNPEFFKSHKKHTQYFNNLEHIRKQDIKVMGVLSDKKQQKYKYNYKK